MKKIDLLVTLDYSASGAQLVIFQKHSKQTYPLILDNSLASYTKANSSDSTAHSRRHDNFVSIFRKTNS